MYHSGLAPLPGANHYAARREGGVVPLREGSRSSLERTITLRGEGGWVVPLRGGSRRSLERTIALRGGAGCTTAGRGRVWRPLLLLRRCPAALQGAAAPRPRGCPSSRPAAPRAQVRGLRGTGRPRGGQEPRGAGTGLAAWAARGGGGGGGRRWAGAGGRRPDSASGAAGVPGLPPPPPPVLCCSRRGGNVLSLPLCGVCLPQTGWDRNPPP